MSRHLLPTALAACLLAVTAIAQTPAPITRIRGTVAEAQDRTMTIATREGPKVEVILNDPLTVNSMKKLDIADLKPGTYVGIASRTGADGKAQAIEVLVLPDAMRGAGEGHYPWDLEPGSMMTNAYVSSSVQAESGRDLTLTYKTGTIDIVVPPGAPIVTFAAAERADLKPGASVMFGATKNAQGKLTASRVTVSKNGVAPPM